MRRISDRQYASIESARYAPQVISDSSQGSGLGLRAHLLEADWNDLTSSGTQRVFRAAERLFLQGDRGDHVFAIIHGAAKVVRGEATGGQTLLTIRTAGDVVGDIAALDGGERSASVSALTRLDCRLVDGASFREFVNRQSVAPAFARYTMSRLRESDRQRTELAQLPVLERVARALVRLHEAAAGGPDHSSVRLPQQDLAELVGASRNAIVLALGVLRAERLIDTQRRHVAVLDLETLRRRSSQVDDRH